jgi:hypothetical protein
MWFSAMVAEEYNRLWPRLANHEISAQQKALAVRGIFIELFISKLPG